ncbi:MAG: hypothetical protein A2508_00105 [Candidatus Lambdaproteobacteria bacterium RIFOXYD12_FULL_49_8]|uniref:Uncharacterized protein n=1 Tax=Candidatus Lambdaproteobacteria bacterium RIFOXYD2_FULL_50_16 TaxID=1817772 RepID=A0A1F6GAC8_9PROT|nr:MAG: hypothetical protein A2527_12585 [Candidatus Lambdaproteobacteria bacterium RIFOXYD2_FULL_50_16]OGG97510.1 MAG: hypothetical protein A2508_00105 [Candidatus Lambdaproteobacteria bacterium RIFOXYD12_FULL_49_8]
MKSLLPLFLLIFFSPSLWAQDLKVQWPMGWQMEKSVNEPLKAGSAQQKTVEYWKGPEAGQEAKLEHLPVRTPPVKIFNDFANSRSCTELKRIFEAKGQLKEGAFASYKFLLRCPIESGYRFWVGAAVKGDKIGYLFYFTFEASDLLPEEIVGRYEQTPGYLSLK